MSVYDIQMFKPDRHIRYMETKIQLDQIVT